MKKMILSIAMLLFAIPAAFAEDAAPANAKPAPAVAAVMPADAPETPPSWWSKAGDGHFQTANPGYFDLGGGYAFIPAVNGVSPSSSGFMVSVKAYPWGRWYAPKRKVTPAEVVKKTQAAGAEGDKIAAAVQALQDAMSSQAELFPVEGQNSWYNRISVFYGRSPSSFDATAVNGGMDALGFAYDIVPEFAVTFGVANYRATQTNGSDKLQQTLMFGIQMNLNAFSSMRNISN